MLVLECNKWMGAKSPKRSIYLKARFHLKKTNISKWYSFFTNFIKKRLHQNYVIMKIIKDAH